MIGIIIFLITLMAEIIFFVVRLKQKSLLRKEKGILNVFQFTVFLLLIAAGLVHWGFRWMLLFGLLFLRGLIGIGILIRKKSGKEYRLSVAITGFLLSLMIITMAAMPFLLFPQCKSLPVSGNYEIATEVYTWKDEKRLETFETDGSNREVTVQFWYPKTEKNEKFPLVVFSHGAFGFRMSNYSTYNELASNGYVVCSIDHPYHAFVTKQADGKIITVNPEFMKSVGRINEKGVSENEIFDITRDWMKLRCADMNFILDTIIKKTSVQQEGGVFDRIDVTRIGLMGHSLGGATAVTVGRQRTDIDAVIDLDGTMLGEEISCIDNKYTINEIPYPVPLLCIDTTAHYKEGLKYKDQYVNNVILKNAADAMETHFDGAEHMNFTDLVFFSPAIASILGSGKINKTDCIQTMNEVILDYYNHYLKQMDKPDIKESYSFR
ncbi:alpha/beta hydrolase family protein [Anaerocolumna sp. MB42-C2]|uniref:alpha/beta hydrolase family protein n=1 Tax=Anaerocolumna sp. MB42-C2 TaxID=3070997 RepID=UPI0027DFDD2E|nr:hypothetical protein [Anaerocolumna sp. MB42-C2]WMJ89124.1 hypothetical protein RBU59_06255 [Anaerocolumna sp. MB42-C2]